MLHRRIFRLLPLPAVLLALVPAIASFSQDLSSHEEELLGIRREIARLEDRLGNARKREETLANRLETLEVELELQRQKVAEAEAARDLAIERVEATEAEVAELEVTLEAARHALRKRLIGLYQLGRQGYIRLLLSVEPGGDLLQAIRMFRFLVLRDATLIDTYVSTRDRLEKERENLVAWQEDSHAWAAREGERRDELVSARRRHEALLAEAAAERRSLASRTELLEEKERRLEDLIRSLSESAGTGFEGRPIQDFRGVLDWPVEGDVTAGFGPRLDPRYGTRVPHNGIEVAGGPDSPVRVVYPGKVVFAAPLEGYGPTVVVLHPGRVFTLYAGLASLRVAADDVLSFGRTIGVTGDHLYFEIRVDNRPQDPAQWLR